MRPTEKRSRRRRPAVQARPPGPDRGRRRCPPPWRRIAPQRTRAAPSRHRDRLRACRRPASPPRRPAAIDSSSTLDNASFSDGITDTVEWPHAGTSNRRTVKWIARRMQNARRGSSRFWYCGREAGSPTTRKWAARGNRGARMPPLQECSMPLRGTTVTRGDERRAGGQANSRRLHPDPPARRRAEIHAVRSTTMRAGSYP